MKKELEDYRINERIREPKVRLVGENVEAGVYNTREALQIAESMYLDLVEISRGELPICKIVDFQKFLYDKKKKEKEQIKKQKATQIELKEIRLTPNTDKHDFEFKLKHAINFLKDNNRVRVTVFFKGREITYRESGDLMILKFAENLSEFGVVEALPKLEGKRLSLVVKPKK